MKTLLTLLLVACPAILAAEMNLLDGHLRITLPDNAQGETARPPIWEHPEICGNTFIQIGEGQEKITLFAQELGRIAAADFMERQAKSLKEQFKGDAFEIGELPGMVYALATTPPESSDRTILFATAFIRHQDGTMQRLDFRATPEKAKDIKTCRRMVLGALRSVKPGDKQLTLHARDERIARVGDKGHWLTLSLPDGCYASYSEGEDFLVAEYKVLCSQGERDSRLLIYLGWWPNPGDDTPTETRKRKLLGQTAIWNIQTFPDEPYCYADCLVPLPAGNDGLLLHLNIAAADGTKLDELIRWAESLRLEKSAEPPADSKG